MVNSSTKRQNELFSEVWKLFSQSCTDVPAQLPSAMLPRQARGTCKKTVIQTSETVHFVSWYVFAALYTLLHWQKAALGLGFPHWCTNETLVDMFYHRGTCP